MSSRTRDLLWCKAIVESGIDPAEMHKVIAKFNELRPDQDPDRDLAVGRDGHIWGDTRYYERTTEKGQDDG